MTVLQNLGGALLLFPLLLCGVLPTTLNETSGLQESVLEEVTFNDTQTENCTKDEYRCENGQCIPSSQRCNRIKDCDDLSDEKSCLLFHRTCFSDEFQCKETNFCVFQSWVCDNYNDCLDGSDELNCKGCFDDEFTCSNGQCIKMSSRCNTLIDCLDGGDEVNCTETHPPAKVACSPKQFTCTSDQSCLPERVRCNSVRDCEDGSDEAFCNYIPCLQDEIQCKESGRCIFKQWVCDGYADCIDGSDEENCGTISMPVTELVTSAPSAMSAIHAQPSSIQKDLLSEACPEYFENFEGLCLRIFAFPRKWLRAKDICRQHNSRLVEFPNESSFLDNFQDFLKQRGMNGINYWIGTPKGATEDFPTVEMMIPPWILNGRKIHGLPFPMYVDNCHFLHFQEFKIYKSMDCYDRAGLICEYTANELFRRV